MSHSDLLAIGEFSRIVGLTVKTLRFYHEQGLLVPRAVDDETGYRYYHTSQAETARVIGRLRGWDVPVTEIREILRDCRDGADVLGFLISHRRTIEERLRRERQIVQQLDELIRYEKEAKSIMNQANYEVEEKTIEPMRIAGVRMRGKYSECGGGFAKIGRRFGRHICGKPLLLHYDDEYRADDADFEACMPIRKGDSTDGIEVRDLPGGRCVALLHQGPYEDLGRSYARILQYIKDHGYEIDMPTREVYIKGPGMILLGNPKKYLTEIQFFLRT